MTNIINGKEIAAALRNEIKKEVIELKNKYGNAPGLAVVQVGNNPASSVYVKNKTKNALEVGIDVIDHYKEESLTQDELLKLIDDLNHEKNVSGILVQLPLPKHINEQIVLDSINPEKDADGFHPFNVGKLSIAAQNDEKLLMPCTPYGCLLMLKKLKINLEGNNAIIIGRSNIVGKPMAQLLLKESCTVTIAHSKTLNLPDVCKNADIVVAAIGKPEMVQGSWIKEGSIVIDVGINRIKIKKEGQNKTMLVGDVNYKEAEKKASAITPVPGGVGPMTIACLLRNTIIAYKNNLKRG